MLCLPRNRADLPQQLPVQDLTHVLYAFANVRPETGKWANRSFHCSMLLFFAKEYVGKAKCT